MSEGSSAFRQAKLGQAQLGVQSCCNPSNGWQHTVVLQTSGGGGTPPGHGCWTKLLEGWQQGCGADWLSTDSTTLTERQAAEQSEP